MPTPTTGWDETSPAGSDALNAGDNRIREMKTQIREVIDVDHKFASSGSDADNGCHDQVTLLEKADLGSGAVGKTILGSQTVSGKGELVYTDEDNNDVQITTGGKIATLNLKSSAVADMTNLMTLIYPVGSVYINASVSTNPGTLLGVGTWTAITDRMIVGVGSTFASAGLTGGNVTIDLSHTHTVANTGWGEQPTPASGKLLVGVIDGGASSSNNGINTGSSGSATQDIMNPYYSAYVWRRTA